jgi:hypothetical protein
MPPAVPAFALRYHDGDGCGDGVVQIRGVIYCLEHLGPWCAAAAAYLDLLAPPATADEEAALAEQAAQEEEGGDMWQEGQEEDEDGEWQH